MRLQPLQQTPKPTYPTKKLSQTTIARKVRRVAAIAGISVALAAGSLGCAGTSMNGPASVDAPPAEIVVAEQLPDSLEEEQVASPLPPANENGEVRLRGRIPATALPRQTETMAEGPRGPSLRPGDTSNGPGAAATTEPSTTTEVALTPIPRPDPSDWQERIAGGIRAPDLQ